ncbi:MAG: ABC transporter permease [Aliidongia sp.]
MRRVLLIARREYRQHLRTRGFWIGLLLIPLIMMASTVLPLLFEDKGGDAILVADPSGRILPTIDQALERDYQKILMRRLSIYAEENDAHPNDGSTDWARHSLWYSDADADAFGAAGGINAALAALKPLPAAHSAPFKRPTRPLVLAPFPDWLTPSAPLSDLDALIPPFLRGEPKIDTAAGPRRVIAVVLLPRTLEPGADWEIWTNGSVGSGIIGLISDMVERQSRDAILGAAGFDAAALARIEAGAIAPKVNAPQRRAAVSSNMVRQLIPVAGAWLLWMTIMMVSNVLLQGLIEERSNKLIEALLATVTAHELMIGKLMGVAGIGFTIAATWTIFAVASVHFAPPDIALVLRPALAPYASVATVAGLVFYFITGYLAVATLFLVIGAMCDSLHDAQAYMTPLVVILLAPLVLLRPALADPHGALPVILSWIPIYTPFVMLGRLGTNVSTFEIVSSGVLLIGFIALELLVAGRLFRAHLLLTGQPPRLRALLRVCLKKAE